MDMATLQSTASAGLSDYEKQKALCDILKTEARALERLPELLRLFEALQSKCNALDSRCSSLQNQCTTLEQQCKDLSFYATLICCPGNILYSQPTLDNYSDEARLEFDQIVQDLGGDYVNAFPIPPGKKMLLKTPKRPGFCPSKIAADFGLANNGNNYLDIRMQFIISADNVDPVDAGTEIGNHYSGNDFLDKDGRQKDRPFPTWRNRVICIGSLEQIYVELTHKGGANNIDSAQIRLWHENNAWYKACAEQGSCKPLVVVPT